MSDEDLLRAKTISILRTRPCLDIRFSIAGITLMGYGYGYIADMLALDSVHVAIGNTGGFTATYDNKSNTITFGTRNPADLGTVDGRGTVIHECTHAVIDAVAKGRSVAYGDDEVAAYLAQTVYSLNAGDKINKVGPVAGPLYAVASKIRAAQGVYVVDPAEIVGVRAQILAVYTAIAKSQGKVVPTTTVMSGVP